jgi:GST-like protein
MITAYLWGTPNGYKVAIALEEMGLDYEINWVDIGAGEQHEPDVSRDFAERENSCDRR